jgi:hypothetical protein
MGQPYHVHGRVVQHAGEAGLGQPTRLGPNTEPRRAQLTGGGSLVPPHQQEALTPVYKPGCGRLGKLLSQCRQHIDCPGPSLPCGAY